MGFCSSIGLSLTQEDSLIVVEKIRILKRKDAYVRSLLVFLCLIVLVCGARFECLEQEPELKKPSASAILMRDNISEQIGQAMALAASLKSVKSEVLLLQRMLSEQQAFTNNMSGVAFSSAGGRNEAKGEGG